MYDYLIVGAGPFGSVCAHELHKIGKKVLVIDKRDSVGGNCFTENIDGVHVHKYGAHIFHTNDEVIFNYIKQFAPFRQYTHNVIANFNGKMFTLPFNLWTFNQLWGTKNEFDARKKLETQLYKGKINNLEDQALSMVGKDIYDTLIQGYTEKQWGRSCKELPSSIIKRIPLRFTWESNYFDDKFTALPIGGYTQIFKKMLEGITVQLNTDFFENREYFEGLSEKIIYTGPIDKYFDYKYGKLEYRSLDWYTKKVDSDNFQGNPVVNYTDSYTPYTRVLEHKWFDYQGQKGSIISFEFPKQYDGRNEPYYPIRDENNTKIYEMYKSLSDSESKVLFGGRLASYVYYDMHQVMAQALKMVENLNK